MQSFRRQEHALIYTIPALALTFVFFVRSLGVFDRGISFQVEWPWSDGIYRLG